MNFLYPAFLFGLLSIAVPVIIHLFNFRKYKKVYFTNIRFLKEIKQESESKSKIKNYLILASRILALACLVFAFAQPFIPVSGSTSKKGQKAISIFVDNSFSMEALTKSGTLFDQAKKRAAEIAGAFGDADKFQLLTNDFEGKHQRLLSKEEFLQALEECKISSASKKLSESYARQKDVLNTSGADDKRMYVLSDFQRSNFDITKTLADTSINTFLIPLSAQKTGNVYIDTCWFDSPVQQLGMNQQLHVRIVNNSDNNLENATLKFYINDKLVSPITFNAEPNSSTETTFSFLLKEKGLQNCRLEIEDHPIVFDDKLYFSFEVKQSITTLVINGTESTSAGFFRSLMQNDSVFRFAEQSEKAIEYSRFPKTDLIVLNGIKELSSGLISELKKYSDNGGSVFFIPAEKGNIVSYNNFLSIIGSVSFAREDTSDLKADKINYEQGLYDGVFEKKQDGIDLPKVFSHYSFSGVLKGNQDVIIKLMNGDPLLVQSGFPNGSKVYISSASFDEQACNFGRHALFVPTLIRMAINSSIIRPLYYASGKDELIVIKDAGIAEEGLVHIMSADKQTDIIPEIKKEPGILKLFTRSQISVAGNYLISYSEKERDGVSFNYSRTESATEMMNSEEITKFIEESGIQAMNMISAGEKSLTQSIAEASEGIKLWKLFVILTLVFVLIDNLINPIFEMNILIKSATVVDSTSPHNGKKVDLLIEKGVITQIKNSIKNDKGYKTVEGNNLCVSPGWMDMQSRFCDPGLEHKEDLETGIAAAAAGGFTAVCMMPNTEPPLHAKAQIDYVVNRTKNAIVDVYPAGALTHNREGKDMAEMYDMKLSGAVAFTDDKRPVKDAGLLMRALQYAGNIDALIMTHCEDLSLSHGGQMHEGETSTRIGLKGMPALAEEIMLQRNIKVAEYTNGRLHVNCISTKNSVELVKKAKADGLKITASVAAHNLLLDETKLADFDSNYKVNPPLRTKEDQDALKKGLANGVIDVIVSDHNPEDIENKELEFDLARFGIISLQTTYAAANMATQSKLTPEQLVEKLCHNPRKLLGIEIPEIKEGAEANLTLFEPETEWILQQKDILSKSKNSPFLGVKLKGKVLGIVNNNSAKIN